jgi:hypothetical protein
VPEEPPTLSAFTAPLAVPRPPTPTGTATALTPAGSLPAAAGPAPVSAGRGTVYGGQTGLPTSANADAPLQQSGSLTGMILARGQSALYQPAKRRSRLVSALIYTGAVLGFLAIIGGIVYTLAGDFLRALFNAISHV